VKFDALHEVQDGPGNVNVIYVQWQNDGERAVVWPKEVASGKMIDPPWMMKN
jgi:branched-chain amino acid transport system substrate-binding protein